jgi:hypothetical protein
MGTLFAFLVGWVVGARGGRQGYDDVVRAAREVLASDEVAVLKVAVRQHAVFTLTQLAEWLQSAEEGDLVDDAVGRIRRLVQPFAAAVDVPAGGRD